MHHDDTEEHDPTDEAFQAAKAELNRAVAAYIEQLAPGSYLDGWVIGTRRIPAEGPYAGKSVINIAAAPDQDWVLTRGIGEMMIESVREGMV